MQHKVNRFYYKMLAIFPEQKPNIILLTLATRLTLGLSVKHEQTGNWPCAGSTGANMFGGMAILKCVEGIDRPALAPLMPNGKGFFLLIDCGANIDCLPD